MTDLENPEKGERTTETAAESEAVFSDSLQNEAALPVGAAEEVAAEGEPEVAPKGKKSKKGKKEKVPLSREERKKNIIKNVKYWTMLNIGVLILSLGVHMFEIPNHFVMGGVSGLSILLTPLFQNIIPNFNENILITIINVILLIIGFIFLGKGVGLKTVFCTVMYNAELWLFELIIPMETTLSGEVATLMEAIYAVVTVGVAQAIIFYCGASSGGTDIIALIVKKYAKVNIGPAVIASDFVIAFLAFFVPGSSKGIAMLSILGVALRSFAIDGIIENIAKTKYVTIITMHPEVVSKVILQDLNRGFTKYDAQGGYTGDPRTIIITVCKRAQAIRLKEKLYLLDPASFVIITDANEILGKGFAAKF